VTILFPPPISPSLIIGLAALLLGVLGFAIAARLRGSTLGSLVVTLRLLFLAVGVVMTLSGLFAATPQTQLANPIPATVDSISAGEEVYLNTCAACHGVDARGGGPQSGTTQVRPPALVGPGSHLGQHTDGDLHYFIGNGLPGGMPAWANRLTDDEIWNVINFLRDLHSAP
jgi:putative copper resistance protein D